MQHRAVIAYKADSARDFEELSQNITARLKAELTKRSSLETLVDAAVVAPVGGLSQFEMVALATIAENVDSPTASVAAYQIRNDMERQG